MPASKIGKIRKINGIVNNCGLNCAIPSVLDQFDRLSDAQHSVTKFDEEYSELKDIFKSYYNLQDISFKQLYDFISAKDPDDQEFILGPILRLYYEQNLQKALPGLRNTEFEDEARAAESFALKFSLVEDYGNENELPEDIPQNSLLEDGVFRASSFNLLQKYFYPKLGIQTTVTTVVKHPDTEKFMPVGVVKVESQKEVSPVDNHLDNINLYYVSQHYELLHPEFDKTYYENLKDDAKRSNDFKELERIRANSGSGVRQAVERFFTEFKKKINSEITKLISREEKEMKSDMDSSILFQVSNQPISPKLEVKAVAADVVSNMIKKVVITTNALTACEKYRETMAQGVDESQAYEVFERALEAYGEFSQLPQKARVIVAEIDAEHRLLEQTLELKTKIEQTSTDSQLKELLESSSIDPRLSDICKSFGKASLSVDEIQGKKQYYQSKLMSNLAPAIEEQKKHLIMSKFKKLTQSFPEENPSQWDLQEYSKQKALLLKEVTSYGTGGTSEFLQSKLTQFEKDLVKRTEESYKKKVRSLTTEFVQNIEGARSRKEMDAYFDVLSIKRAVYLESFKSDLQQLESSGCFEGSVKNTFIQSVALESVRENSGEIKRSWEQAESLIPKEETKDGGLLTFKKTFPDKDFLITYNAHFAQKNPGVSLDIDGLKKKYQGFDDKIDEHQGRLKAWTEYLKKTVASYEQEEEKIETLKTEFSSIKGTTKKQLEKLAEIERNLSSSMEKINLAGAILSKKPQVTNDLKAKITKKREELYRSEELLLETVNAAADELKAKLQPSSSGSIDTKALEQAMGKYTTETGRELSSDVQEMLKQAQSKVSAGASSGEAEHLNDALAIISGDSLQHQLNREDSISSRTDRRSPGLSEEIEAALITIYAPIMQSLNGVVTSSADIDQLDTQLEEIDARFQRFLASIPHESEDERELYIREFSEFREKVYRESVQKFITKPLIEACEALNLQASLEQQTDVIYRIEDFAKLYSDTDFKFVPEEQRQKIADKVCKMELLKAYNDLTQNPQADLSLEQQVNSKTQAFFEKYNRHIGFNWKFFEQELLKLTQQYVEKQASSRAAQHRKEASGSKAGAASGGGREAGFGDLNPTSYSGVGLSQVVPPSQRQAVAAGGGGGGGAVREAGLGVTQQKSSPRQAEGRGAVGFGNQPHPGESQVQKSQTGSQSFFRHESLLPDSAIAATQLKNGLRRAQAGETKETIQVDKDEYELISSESKANAVLKSTGVSNWEKGKTVGEQTATVRQQVCYDVMHMINNVMKQGGEVHINSKDPFITEFANWYVKYLNSSDRGLKIQQPTISIPEVRTKEFERCAESYHTTSGFKLHYEQCSTARKQKLEEAQQLEAGDSASLGRRGGGGGGRGRF